MPLCLDCYDHAGQVVWNNEAPELWRRTIQEAARAMFASVLESAFAKTSYTTAPHPANHGRGWRMSWGRQGLDIEHINAAGDDANLTSWPATSSSTSPRAPRSPG